MSPDAGSSRDARLGPGLLVLVVGPSGAGKDTLIEGAAERLQADPHFVFVTRTVTRDSHGAEQHETMTAADFAKRTTSGQASGFALHWFAHGHGYGIPATIDAEIVRGHTVIANVSRTVIGMARLRYAHVRVLLVDAAPDVRKRRILARGRETAAEVDARMARSVGDFSPDAADVVVMNDGDLATGIDQFVAALRA